MAQLLPEQRKKVKKPLLWIGMGSIVMTFAGLTSGYVVSRSALLAEDAWLQFPLPIHFYYATAIIIAASLGMIAGWLAIRKNNQSGLVIWLAVSLILGVTFAVMQYLGWQDLIDRSLFFTGKGSSTAASWVYVITFLHWLHVISGIIVLTVTLFQAMRGAYNKESYLGFSLASIFWHFLGVLWIYLFCFLVFIR